ncbi:NAD binding domain of 6-phosphogluconate dehydrogenase-domain-containing protein [Kockovaella imperatae]|uniref:NAD binding domain of 6-phosphogluconate dehydrogenase-domain-containing protein n=1 Tax=Kockovaella imperatae TaxID=4999 RepID=A0A1Y1U9P5_9TREE|nr:NAD binding domain of 6-phosphogluconate dehydrogenase-domain-containing protein [Kockovaella imperatae]ORX34751.1 NAD binding domain of 6-phosphogluconate dehydrogenase-domain-containing protein [Kockovaella imperatae]
MASANVPLVAWIGLGAMGLPMATCLAKNGVTVQAYDVWAPSLEKAVQGGCKGCGSPSEAAQGASILGLMVVNVGQVEDLLFGEPRVAEALATGAVIVVFSTCPPSAMSLLQDRLDLLKKDIHIIDSPVSGGSTRAGAGTLAIMSSGPSSAIEKARPMIELLTQPPEGGLSVVGDKLGAASDFKLINQVYCAIQICVTGEAMAFAKSLGLNPRLAYNVIKTASGSSFMFGHRVPWQLRDDGILKSAMTIIAKDVGIVMDEARLHCFPAPMCSVAEQVFTAALGAGLAREDDGNVVKLWSRFGVPHEYETGTDAEETDKAKELNLKAGPKPSKVLFMDALDRYAKVGGTTTDDPAKDAAECDVVVITTVTALQAEAALLSIAPSLRADSTIIVCSTIAPSDAVRLDGIARKHNVSVVDAPISGGPTKAAAGDLTIMASGTDEALVKALPVLQAMAKNSSKLHLIPGGAGSGSKLKIVNNLLAGIHICAAAEATAFARKKGMDLLAVYDVVSKGAAASTVMVDRMPRMLAKNPPVFSATTTFVKDLGLALSEGKRANCPLFLGAAAHQQFIRAVASGWAKEDDSAVSRLWEFMGIDVTLSS